MDGYVNFHDFKVSLYNACVILFGSCFKTWHQILQAALCCVQITKNKNTEFFERSTCALHMFRYIVSGICNVKHIRVQLIMSVYMGIEYNFIFLILLRSTSMKINNLITYQTLFNFRMPIYAHFYCTLFAREKLLQCRIE